MWSPRFARQRGQAGHSTSTKRQEEVASSAQNRTLVQQTVLCLSIAGVLVGVRGRNDYKGRPSPLILTSYSFAVTTVPRAIGLFSPAAADENTTGSGQSDGKWPTERAGLARSAWEVVFGKLLTRGMSEEVTQNPVFTGTPFQLAKVTWPCSRPLYPA